MCTPRAAAATAKNIRDEVEYGNNHLLHMSELDTLLGTKWQEDRTIVIPDTMAMITFAMAEMTALMPAKEQ